VGEMFNVFKPKGRLSFVKKILPKLREQWGKKYRHDPHIETIKEKNKNVLYMYAGWPPADLPEDTGSGPMIGLPL
jgi:hypothetical protein